MVTRLVDVPRSVGDLISQAVKRFAHERRWDDEHFDLWYHDEPVWIVRDWKQASLARDDRTRRLVIRVQLAAFDTHNLNESVQAIPDAYIVEDGRISKRAKKKDRRAVSEVRSQAIYSLVALENSARAERPDEVISIVRGLIEDAWSQAEILGSQLQESAGS